VVIKVTHRPVAVSYFTTFLTRHQHPREAELTARIIVILPVHGNMALRWRVRANNPFDYQAISSPSAWDRSAPADRNVRWCGAFVAALLPKRGAR
jgi:hypothetical protein